MRLWLLLILLASCLAAQAPVEAPRGDKDSGSGREKLLQLVSVKRVFVERLNGGETAAQMRDMIISSLERSRLFAITENPERADAVLRGSAEDLVFTETFSSSEGINARGTVGASRSATSSTKAQRGYADVGVGETESLRTAERRHEAAASVRLVNKDGDVIWSTTQESMGGKFRGASADVADKITRQLSNDFELGRKAQAAPK